MDRENVEPTKRPKDGRFFQQKLPAWQPQFSAKNAAITFIVMGVIFIPIGAVLLVTSNSVVEYSFDYTDCTDSNNVTCVERLHTNPYCICSLNILIKSTIPGPVYLYYELTNFYQNHRRYAGSKNDPQLLGIQQSPNSLSSCSPYATVVNSTGTFAILPCGAIANSIFNDTFLLIRKADGANVDLSNTGIAWKSDIDKKFGTLTPEAMRNTVKPPNWPHPISAFRNPFKGYEELMVWMRVAALPSFRKLHRRIVHNGDFANGLPAGTYTVSVNYSFPVSSFNGRKSLVIGNVSWLGGKNITLGVTCLVTGSLHLIIGCIFLAVYIYSGRSPTEECLPFSSHLLVGLISSTQPPTIG